MSDTLDDAIDKYLVPAEQNNGFYAIFLPTAECNVSTDFIEAHSDGFVRTQKTITLKTEFPTIFIEHDDPSKKLIGGPLEAVLLFRPKEY